MDRPTSKEFQVKEINQSKVYYPEDLEAHGSWIAFSDNGTAACLMNGGSIPHKRKSQYRKSRGLVVLESFEFNTVTDFHQHYDFEDIEPFTLLIRSEREFYKIIHNEQETLIEAQDPGLRNIWSSTTLYTKEVRDKREKWFEAWLAGNPELNSLSIRNFHRSAGEGDNENDLVMSRWGLLKTLSVTQISVIEQKAQLVYQDFIQDSIANLEVSVNHP